MAPPKGTPCRRRLWGGATRYRIRLLDLLSAFHRKDASMSKQRILILGSTGSIGRSSLEVLAGLRDGFEVVGLAGCSSWKLLAEQVSTWRPGSVAITDEEAGRSLRSAIDGGIQVHTGTDAMTEMIDAEEFDCVIIGVVGAAALGPTIRAVELGKRVAIANKESLVMAGSLLAPLAKKSKAQLLPVDSEHSAVFQAMHAGRAGDCRRVVLTASGGPFRTWSAERIARATVQEALKHPTWSMGPKVTIDSATMMNKALEIVEARWLFGLRPDQIEVIIHPESIIHSLVEFRDGSMVAQLGTPDMRTPIQYALTYPDRLPCPSPGLDLAAIREMHFYPPDTERFPALELGHMVARRGGTAGAVLNGANESAVQLFRDGVIGFADIASTVRAVLDRHDWSADPGLEELLRADSWARNEVMRCAAC